MSEKMNSGSGGFDVIALSNVKSKKTSKGGTLSDLFKCVESLASSTENLRDFVAGCECDKGEMETYEVYLKGLLKIQDGLLEKAQEKIRDLGHIPIGGNFMSDELSSKIAKD
jgi:hypothetical protein